MKKILLIMILACLSNLSFSADLLEVYQDALKSDPVFLQAVANRLATKQGVPISLAAILPNINITGNAGVSKANYSGSFVNDKFVDGQFVQANPNSNTQRTYQMSLILNQTIFNFAQFSTIASQLAISKEADANLNAALQDLMIRVSNAYFAVLYDEDNLSYTEASKLAYKEQLDQVNEQYKVGLKTITEVYTARASYDSSVALNIAAETRLNNDRENLRVITGKYYDHLYALKDDFPLTKPTPQNVEDWVTIVVQQNWTIKSVQYAVDAAREIVKQQFAGHLPTLSLQAQLDKSYQQNIHASPSYLLIKGAGTEVDKSIFLNLNVPVFSGGAVYAQTKQASYQFEATQQQLEQTVRETINLARQSYRNILSGISQISADKQAIKSNISSLEGMEASYRVGTTTLVDVLNQQQKLLLAQTQYATDRYSYVGNLLLLKQAAGTLSFEDLKVLNNWLTDKPVQRINKKKIRK